MRTTPLAALALGAAIVATSCTEHRFLEFSPALERVTIVELTDDPFPYDSVARVDLHVVSIDVSAQPDTNPTSPAWHTVATPNRSYDLVALTGGATDTLGGTQIPAGTYRAVRMVIDPSRSRITAKDGRALPVDWQQTAFNPRLYALVEDPIGVSDTGAQIVIDFDVGRSFLCSAPCTSFVFSPVFRAVNKAATGAVSGRVRGDTLAISPEPIHDVTVTVYSGDPTFEPGWYVRATAKTDAAGNFRIAYLLPGTYILRADAPRGSSFTPGVLSNVLVRQGSETQGVNITLPRQEPWRITITPLPVQLRVRDSLYLSAQLVDSLGQALPGVSFTWASLDTSVVRLFPDASRSDRAFLLAVGAGTARIQVWGGGLTAVYIFPVLAVIPGAIATIAVAPFTTLARVGDSVGVIGTAYDSVGNFVPAGFNWSSSDTLIARVINVSLTGNYAVYRALAPGTFAMRASANGVTGTATVTVNP
jgi:hypothetical protein